jgi:hypothetical protein
MRISRAQARRNAAISRGIPSHKKRGAMKKLYAYFEAVCGGEHELKYDRINYTMIEFYGPFRPDAGLECLLVNVLPHVECPLRLAQYLFFADGTVVVEKLDPYTTLHKGPYLRRRSSASWEGGARSLFACILKETESFIDWMESQRAKIKSQLVQAKQSVKKR